MSIRTGIRNWLLAEPATHDGPCECGKHNQGGLPRQSSLEQPHDGPDFTKPGLRFTDKRMVSDQRWLMLVFDGPTDYLLAAFIADTYPEVREEAEAFARDWQMQRELKMRGHANHG